MERKKRVRKMSTDEQPTTTVRQSRRLAGVAPEFGLLDTRRLMRQSSAPEPAQLDDHVDLPTSSPERKREAEGSSHVSPSTNSPDTRPPPKKPTLAPDADLAPEPSHNDIVNKQELEALHFFQKAHEDRSRLLDDRETRLVEMAESAAQAAEAHETYRQEQFKEALGYLQECYQRELDLARCVVGNEANETLSQEIEKQQATWEAWMLRFQENLELTYDKERALLLPDKEVSLLALKNQHTDELLRVSTEAEHTI
ncbi:hypothetical protein DYB25_009981 [Aphanomyces astaci]|uniref:Uncharacterized protein n=1 Tax=Aphanomyces astaci TaxID=112090 RepID=A0A397AFS6_APHAT|nr:hypothetical protein DYB25_009981 [Aphanomyces astaci]RHY12453.1 hypothetical protein DYB36_009322 [Aphanomyces astaci]RHY49136.1 hypothetical protein DYB38_009821 [Aphanomyces astaci]RHY54284.1 hypothetical protein DYB30_009244 [Aphanomyces astaci]RHY69919.1 hypothetical protein DYB34_010548 [Aphanomyces astaci]